MKPFFQVQPLTDVHARAAAIAPGRVERVGLAEAAGRSLAVDLCAPADLPGFARATMDGYAVRGRDTFGAAETSPVYLTLAGEIAMGEVPTLKLVAGQCARIGTGGMMPAGANAVVMVEHTRALADGSVEVTQPVAPGGHMLGADDDAHAGERMLTAGQRLRPQDVGLMAALGRSQVQVYRQPRVAILSTGDEVVPIDATLRPGQVRDVNSHSLAAQVRAAGGLPVPCGLVGDDREALKGAVAGALPHCDLLLLSGGSSMGVRDLTAEVFLGFPGAEMWVHGVAVAPGKPFIWVAADAGHLLGLPGQVTSCMVAFHVFVEPMMERMLGRPALAFSRFGRQLATLTRSLPSVSGRTEFVRVQTFLSEDGWRAEPLFGKSGLIRTLVRADGLVVVAADSEGLDAGAAIEVLRFP